MFIDGDVSISKGGYLTIKCDYSWKEVLENFHTHLTVYYKSFNITSSDINY
jgi:predicted SpoU family rRNA methylase